MIWLVIAAISSLILWVSFWAYQISKDPLPEKTSESRRSLLISGAVFAPLVPFLFWRQHLPKLEEPAPKLRQTEKWERPTGPVARRLYLGFDSIDKIKPGERFTLKTTPQDVYSPKRLMIPESIASQIVITDIKIGNISQLSSSVPGQYFGMAPANPIELRMDTCQITQPITIKGVNVSGGPIRVRCAMIGYVARI